MNSRIILLFCSLLSCTSANAARIQFGLSAGAAFATQEWNIQSIRTDTENKRRLGADLSLFSTIALGENIALQPELHYVQKGFERTIERVTTQDLVAQGTITFRPYAEFLSVPVLLKASLRSIPGHTYILAGPRVDFLLRTQADNYQSVFDNLPNVDLGATLGLGIQLVQFKNRRLSMELRYNPNFSYSHPLSFLDVRLNSIDVLFVIQ